MQQRISCKSETDSALMAQQRSWSCFLFVSYSSWSFLRCSLSLDHGGHFTRTHWSCDHGGSWSFGNFEVWSLIQPSTLRCNPSTFIADHWENKLLREKSLKSLTLILRFWDGIGEIGKPGGYGLFWSDGFWSFTRKCGLECERWMKDEMKKYMLRNWTPAINECDW